MKVPDSETTAEAGVNLVGLIINQDFRWILRNQLSSDLGVDAHIEIVTDGRGTGRLLGLQIKTGRSYFRKGKGGFVFRPDRRHVDYWLAHSLPILVVLASAEDRKAYWQIVSRDTLERAGDGYKITVPVDQELVPDHREKLASYAEADPYILRLRGFQLARQWMYLLEQGAELVLTADEWINKSSGRIELTLTASGPQGQQLGQFHWPYVIFPGAEYSEELPRMFPWAHLELDDDAYEEAERAEWEMECGIWDKEDGRFCYGESFEDWSRSRTLPGLRPYEEVAGEAARWRLRLVLNDIGRAFLTIDRQLSDGLVPLS